MRNLVALGKLVYDQVYELKEDHSIDETAKEQIYVKCVQLIQVNICMPKNNPVDFTEY